MRCEEFPINHNEMIDVYGRCNTCFSSIYTDENDDADKIYKAMSEIKLNDSPHYYHFVCGFQFIIAFDGCEFGKDQWGGLWRNTSFRNDGFACAMTPEPVDPKYLDVFMDMYNNLINAKIEK